MARWKVLLFTSLAAIFTFVAQVSAASACAWVHYQPGCPESLRKY